MLVREWSGVRLQRRRLDAEADETSSYRRRERAERWTVDEAMRAASNNDNDTRNSSDQ